MSAYNYKEAALNPTNPRDRTTDWEADIVNVFRADPLRAEVAGNRDTPLGPVFYVSAPIRAEASCPECHGNPAQAPAAILKAYGNANGFGWKEVEIIGAQVVTVAHDVATRLVESCAQQHRELVVLVPRRHFRGGESLSILLSERFGYCPFGEVKTPRIL